MLGPQLMQKYKVMIEFGQSICTPEPDKKYQLKVMINQVGFESGEPIQYDNFYNRWSQRIPMGEISLPNIDPSIERDDYTDIGFNERFVFVYLMDEGYPISYWKGSLA